jgi:hypothetical protein
MTVNTSATLEKVFPVCSNDYGEAKCWKGTVEIAQQKVRFQFNGALSPKNKTTLSGDFDYELILQVHTQATKQLLGSTEERKSDVRSQSAPLPENSVVRIKNNRAQKTVKVESDETAFYVRGIGMAQILDSSKKELLDGVSFSIAMRRKVRSESAPTLGSSSSSPTPVVSVSPSIFISRPFQLLSKVSPKPVSLVSFVFPETRPNEIVRLAEKNGEVMRPKPVKQTSTTLSSHSQTLTSSV